MILSCAVTFEPTEENLDRTIRQLLCTGHVAAVFDNSSCDGSASRTRDRCNERRVAYLSTGSNIGVGAGLNRLLVYAAGRGLEWMLYLDQDSVLGEQYREALPTAVVFAASADGVAVVGSRIKHKETLRDEPPMKRFEKVRYVIGSGMLLNVPVVAAVGGFDEGLFVDTVDHELCLRLRAGGMSIVRDNDRVLWHEVGHDLRLIERRHGFFVTRHPLWRRELMWRNSVILVRRYGAAFPLDCLKHVGSRCLDTVLGSIVYREFGYLTAGVRGLLAGLRESPSRSGLELDGTHPTRGFGPRSAP